MRCRLCVRGRGEARGAWFALSQLSTPQLPQTRDVGLAVARFAAYPNMRGVSIGADNAGYVQYWNWWGCRAL